MSKIETDVIGQHYGAERDNGVDNAKLIAVNKSLREHPVEVVGARLRASMTAMKPIV